MSDWGTSMTARKAPRASRCIAGAVSLLLATGGLSLMAPAAWADSAPVNPANPATPVTTTADALPTVQINGVAWSQVVVGNTVYVAGKFSTARPAGAAPGTQETVRNNFLAYDIRTGALITSFTPSLNAQALAVAASPDGKRVYVAGDFTQANGQVRNKVAAYDTATGQLVADFRPSVTGQVRALAATNDKLYLGGTLTAVGSTSRTSMAAVSTVNGALLPWAPVPGVGATTGNRLPLFDSRGKPIPNTTDTAANARTSTEVMAMVVTNGGSQVVVAGRFDSLNGQQSTGIGAVDAVSGATRPFAIGQSITNQGVNSAVYSLSTDGTLVYGTGYDYYGPGNLEGTFAVEAAGGKIRWIGDCRGDSYSNFAVGGALYIASHAHDCANIGGFPEQSPQTNRFATAESLSATGKVGAFTLRNTNFVGQPAPSLLEWFPTFAAGTYTGQDQAGWSVSGNSQYVVYGGEFPRVNGTTQQGLVRFAFAGTAPAKMGPTGGGLTPTVVSTTPGTARVSWRESTDQDDENLTYRVYRDNGTTPVYEVTSDSSWYDVNSLAFTDTGLSAGTHTYRVGVTDPTGNKNTGSWTTVTVAAGTTAQRSYAATVKADGASNHWSLGERAGSTVAYDSVGGSDLTVNGGIGLGQAGGIAQDADTAANTYGSNTGFLATKTPVLGPQTFSVEAWFTTTTRAGGKIVGFGSSATGTSANHDRAVYMDTAGRLNFGLWPGATRVVTSPKAYNDGRYHHVVATVDASGMKLSVDGQLVASRTDTTSGQPGYGYWRIGGDSTWSGAQFFSGRVDEVAVYPQALTAAQVGNHFTAGSTGAVVNRPPTAAFTSATTDLTATLDGSSSADPDGTVAAWSWAFGDGTTGTGRTATHTYAAAGTYGVTLTVTDDKGATATRTASVTVTAPVPNVPPTADFTAAGAGLTGTFDASAAKDTDGTVTGYAWAFGDGSTGTGVQASHEYGKDGTYAVTLTVTDDDGATTSSTKQVTVRSAQLASDGFDRTASGGLGTADVGGAWTVSAGGARQSVAGSAAVFAMTKGTNTGSYLGAVSQTSADVRATMSLSAVPAGGSALVYVKARRVAANQEYQGRVRFLTDGTVGVSVSKLAGSSDETLIGGEVLVKGLTYTAGTDLNVRVRAAGTGTTELSVTVWAAGTAEPATPTVTRTDTTASLQAAGGVGLLSYLSGSATAPVDLRVSEFAATPVGTATPPAPVTPANTAPTAAFTSTAGDLTVAVDGSGSTDADGTVAAYAWDFGDGSKGTGVTASHTYPAAGTYPVTLTVTDDDAATGTVSKTVTVTAPAAPEPPVEQPAEQVIAADAFDRTVTGGLGTAEDGGAWTVSAGGVRQSVSGGVATFALTKGTNTGSYLGGVSETSVDVQTSLSLSAVPTGGGAMVYVGARRVDTNLAYQGRVRFLADGTVGVALVKQVGTSDDVLLGREVVLSGLTYTAGSVLNVRVVASGTDATQLSATVWAAGTTEPATPTVTGTDSTAGLQANGSIGLTAYLSGSATAPVDLKFSEITVTPAA